MLARRLEVISGTQSECLQQVQCLLSTPNKSIWISSSPHIPEAIPAKKVRTLLGQETDTIVFDAHSGLDVNALAAVSGTLCAGGCLYLLTPPLAQWPEFADPDYRRFIPHPYQPEQVTGRFLQRLLGLIQQFLHMQAQALALPHTKPSYAEQQAVVQNLVQAQHTVVLTADRGRGKSAALGFAASHLLAAKQTVLLTAPARATVASVFRHAQAEYQPRFIAPDELLQTLPAADVLLVDEAAAIPIPMLLQMQQHYPRCIFATTLHGYEGSGRGFVLRFQQSLRQLAPDWQALRLQQPIRWAQDDPLEQFINQALLLDVDSQLEQVPTLTQGVYRRLDRQQLVEDEVLLRQVFGLLVSAHYQTRPADLRQMLDAPDLSVHVLQQDEHIVAVALLSQEGGLDAELTAAIHAGKRRPHGHLVPQSLTFHAGIPYAATLRCERVMRIAVQPQCQGQGLGQQLLAHLRDYAQQQAVAYLSVSYAASPELLRFWQQAGFAPVRLGFKRDAASGRHSLIQLCPLNTAGEQLCEQAVQRFQQTLPALLAEQLRDIEPELITEIQTAGIHLTASDKLHTASCQSD